jgi:hypothetical protein
MTRSELIAQVKSLNVQTAKPAHMMKTEDLQALVEKNIKGATVEKKPKEDSMKIRIVALHREGLSVKDIQSALEEEGWASRLKCGKIRPIYLKLVIKNI